MNTKRPQLALATGLWLVAEIAAASSAPPSAEPSDRSGAPIAVSPGAPDRTAGSPTACPPFSWTLVPDALRYDLVVLELADAASPARLPSSGLEPAADEAGVVLRHKVPGGADLWLPTESDCLEPGHLYAWSVRAERPSGWSEWSDPHRFTTPGQRVRGRPHDVPPTVRLEDAIRTPANAAEAAAISTSGIVESTVKGFRFPDGSVQTRAFKKTVLHAAVSATGDLIFGDVVSASKLNTGVFQVDIGRPGFGCTATATVGIYDPSELAVIVPGSAMTVVTPTSSVVSVYTANVGAFANLSFMLQVVCSPINLFP